ncbi:uncharacterized protein BP01DRAFT_388545 [Aspergillus saccharolyticus JOP 1030-1]|uniref:glutathione transferase n=1 Tax=Aspergillus saccharolyticus JOP 1030-1 TaxID=1450539 RepID=A0A319AD58_9EURO|nr:hypothetical protein BP01DRAFT_388545 [Aspergillus saccharolyticus JOP 1030-1]PYH49518.1 hypothetical protein BP01DRAFT_388545 [Aspergillus saccharolyticus JOP 1030-1]
MIQPLHIRFPATDAHAWSIIAVAEELSLPYEMMTHTLSNPENKNTDSTAHPHHLHLPVPNPNTTITLFHAAPIIQYLVDCYDTSNVLGGSDNNSTDSHERHQLNQWMHLQTTFREVLDGSSPTTTTITSVPNRTQKLHQILATLNATLMRSSWLVGQRCSYADLAFLAGLHSLLVEAQEGEEGKGEVFARYPFVWAWLRKMAMRGSWRRVLAVRRRAEEQKEVEEEMDVAGGSGSGVQEKGFLDEESEWEEIEGVGVEVEVEDSGRRSQKSGPAVAVSVSAVQTEVLGEAEEEEEEEDKEGLLACAAGFVMQSTATATAPLVDAHGDDEEEEEEEEEEEREGILPCGAFDTHARLPAVVATVVEEKNDDDDEREGILPCTAIGIQTKLRAPETPRVEDEDDEREGILPCGAFDTHAQLPAVIAMVVEDDDEREGILPCAAIGIQKNLRAPETPRVENDADDEREGILPCAAIRMAIAQRTTQSNEDSDEREGILPCGVFSTHAQPPASSRFKPVNHDNDDDFEREGMHPCSLVGMVY